MTGIGSNVRRMNADPVLRARIDEACRDGMKRWWDGRRLPGPWLTLRAIDVATTLARTFGTGTVNIRHSHHIAALAPYARRVAEQGMMLLLMTSAPAGGRVKAMVQTTPAGAKSRSTTPSS